MNDLLSIGINRSILILDMSTLGALVREARERKRLSTTTLSHAVGISQSTLSRIENDRIVEAPEPQLLRRLSDVLELPQPLLLESLGYQVTSDEAPLSDPLSALISRAVNDWTPAQKKLLWQFIEAVDAVIDDSDPHDDDAEEHAS